MNPAQSIILNSQIGATESQFVRAVIDTGPFAKVILLIIALFSVISWAIILYKLVENKKLNRQNKKFLKVFEKSRGDFSSIKQTSDRLEFGTLSRLFNECYQELRSLGRVEQNELIYEKSHLALVQRRMERIFGKEIIRLEKYLIFLATTANVTPFLGLLGTVWGVLGTFMEMSSTSSAITLQQIGPGISEALTPTMLGLAAAIPAVVAYNYFINKVAISRMDR